MNFEPLLESPLLTQLHVALAIAALILGPFALWRKSRDRWHKVAGYLWVFAMAGTALSSFGIMNIRLFGSFSPIHALSLFVLWSLYEGITAARRGQIARHQENMKGLYLWAIGVTGLLTLLPGRLSNEVMLGGAFGWGFVVPAIAIALLLTTVYRKRLLPLGKAMRLF